MTRIRFGAVLVLTAIAATVASAQPGGKQPGVIQFKQFGATPEQFFQSSITRWTGQLTLDLEAVKNDIANTKLAPFVRAAIIQQATDAQVQTAELDQLVRRGVPKDKLVAAFADVEKSLNQLAASINLQPIAKVATAVSLPRADATYQQLAVALGGGDNDAGRLKRRLIRLGETIDDAGDELRTLCADTLPGNDRNLDRALGQFAREARLLARRVRDDANPDLIKQTYVVMGERWAEAVALLGRGRALPQPVTAQATRIDGLYRRLGGVLNLPPFPGGGGPQLPDQKRLSFAAGANAGGNPHVVVFADEKGTVAYSFFAYEKGFDGGVRVDMADLNGDGVAELIVAPGPARGNAVLPVKVFDGRDLNLLIEFVPFPGWKGGLTAVGADLSKDGRALIAVVPDGAPNIKVFDLAQGKEIAEFTAHDPKVVTGGIKLAWGDVNGDGIPDILAVNGPSNTHTRVKVFSGKDAQLLANFPVLDEKYKGGGFVAAVDFANNGQALPVIGLDGGTAPLIRVYDLKGKALVEWLAFDERYRGGVRVAVSARNHIVAASGPGLKNSPVRIFDVTRPKIPVGEVVVFPGFDGGLFVGGR